MTSTVDKPAGDVVVLDIDPYSEESLNSPFGYAAAIRDAGQAVWVPRYQMWAVARYEHVQGALHNWGAFISGHGTGLRDGPGKERWRPPSLLLETDPPDHERFRSVVAPVVTAAVKSVRPELEARATELVDKLVAAGSFDAVKDLAEAFVLRVFPDAVGLPREGRENLLVYSDLAFNSFGADNWLLKKAQEKAPSAVEWVQQSCKRSSLTPGGMGAAIFSAVDEGKFSEEEAETLLRSFLTAGLDTTIATIGNALRYLSDYPGQWAKLHADPGLVRAVFEETLRFESTASIVYRSVAEDIEFAGVQMKKDQKLMVSIAGANHDPAQFPDPERYDIERKARSVGFGFGLHTCIGQMMARTESDVLLGELAKRVKELKPAGEPVRHFNNTVRGFAHVPVSVVAA